MINDTEIKLGSLASHSRFESHSNNNSSYFLSMLSLSLSLSSVSEAENYTAMGVDGTVN
jgi:hypothetical protein